VAAGALAAEPVWKLSAGIDYSSGDYGDVTDTEILYVPLGLKYEALPWALRVTVPWVQIDGPGSVVGAGDGVTVIGGGGPSRRESGLGDIVVGASYSFEDTLGVGSYVELGGKVKFGTADEDEGLGTGKTDYIVQADVGRTYGRWTPMLTLGYKWKGEPAGLQLNDVFFASAGFGYQFDDATSGGLSLDWQEASSTGADDALELMAYGNWRLTREWSLTAYGVGGMSDGSPDWDLGMQATYRF
jgi:hypothetical protein